MRNLPVRFLEGGMGATPSCYSTILPLLLPTQDKLSWYRVVVFDLSNASEASNWAKLPRNNPGASSTLRDGRSCNVPRTRSNREQNAVFAICGTKQHDK